MDATFTEGKLASNGISSPDSQALLSQLFLQHNYCSPLLDFHHCYIGHSHKFVSVFEKTLEISEATNFQSTPPLGFFCSCAIGATTLLPDLSITIASLPRTSAQIPGCLGVLASVDNATNSPGQISGGGSDWAWAVNKTSTCLNAISRTRMKDEVQEDRTCIF